MSFLNPFVLIGLVAAGIPILLHLLHLRRMKTVEFSTLKFLKELQKNTVRSLKIKHWLLLALRTLLIASLVLAFARPVADGDIFGTGGVIANSSMVIVLDNSISMDMSDIQGVRSKKLTQQLQNIMNEVRQGDELALLYMADLEDKRFAELTSSFQTVKENAKNIVLAKQPAQLIPSLRYAIALLSDAKNARKEIIVVSDMQKNIVYDSDSLRSIVQKENIPITFIKIGEQQDIQEGNLSVDSIYPVTTIATPGKIFELKAAITNHGLNAVKDIIVSMMFNGERVAQKNITIDKEKTIWVDLAAIPRVAGVIDVNVAIEADPFLADNERHLALVLQPLPKIALVGSDIKTDFPYLALKAATMDTATVKLSPSEFLSADLSKYDVVLMAEIPTLSAGDVARIKQAVTEGMALVLLGDPSFMEKERGGQLFSGLGGLAVEKRNYSKDKQVSLSDIATEHPLFEGVFLPEALQGQIFDNVKAEEVYIVKGGFSLATIEQQPVLSELTVGQGKVLLSGLSGNTATSSFAVSSVFAPFIVRAVEYGAAKKSVTPQYVLGKTARIEVGGQYLGQGALTLISPDGVQSTISLVPYSGGAYASLERIREAGVYKFVETSGDTVQAIAMNIDKSESIFTQIEEEELFNKLEKSGLDKSKMQIVKQGISLTEQRASIAGRTELWNIFVWVALFCGIAEMALAYSMSRNATLDT